jgi:hypothetical protein
MVVFIPFKTCLESMRSYPWGVIGSAGPVFGLFVLMTGLSSILCIYAFFTTARQAASSRKKREMIVFAFVFCFAVSLIAFNIAAMNGIDTYPVGNFIIIPLGLFGYAIFQQNLKEALNVLNTMIYWAGILFFFGATAMLLFKLSSLSIPGSLYFAGIITWILVHKLIDKGMTSILSLFLVRQREVLEEVFTELPDVLSRIHTHLQIFSALADPVFNDLKSSRFSLCFKTDNSEWLKGWSQHNPRYSFFEGEMVFIVMKRPDDDQFHLYRAYGKHLNEKFRKQFTALSEAVSETDAEFSGGQLTTQPLFIDNYLTGNGYGAVLDGLFNSPIISCRFTAWYQRGGLKKRGRSWMQLKNI